VKVSITRRIQGGLGVQQVGRVAILGFGLIGQSWAALFVHHGWEVTTWDPNPSLALSAVDLTAAKLAQLESISPSRGNGTLAPVSTVAEAVHGAVLVQENAPERTDVKHRLYADVERSAPEDAIIASSTSSLTWTDLAPGFANPARLVTAHPFNPPHIMPLVELYGPDEGTVAAAEQIYQSVGRTVVRLKKPAVGHIANRLASALWREAVNIVASDIADVDAVDRALCAGPGLRWSVVGAHMAYHLGGGEGGLQHYLEHLGSSQERRWSDLGSPRLSVDVREKLVSGVAAEAAGQTVGHLASQRDEKLIAILGALGVSR
jgi:carnitine 3-dehydrogenase